MTDWKTYNTIHFLHEASKFFNTESNTKNMTSHVLLQAKQ